MIACIHGGCVAPGTAQAVAAALTSYRGEAARAQAALTRFYWQAGAGQSLGSCGQVHALVHGWLDNAGELAAELGLAASTAGEVYAAAVARWGAEADAHCIGNYCTIAELADGGLRLARSPWEAPPLYHHSDDGRTVASPLLRVLFASGVPRSLDYERIVDELAYDFRDGEEAGWYHGILQVPVGCVVTFVPGGRKLSRWYSTGRLPRIRMRRSQDYVEAARALLEEAARKALATCIRPAIALSGGLDSALVADALLRAMPRGDRLPAITFVPDRRWDGRSPPTTFGDEEARARSFADFTGRIDLHIADPELGGFDFRAREVFQAMEIFAPGLANVGMMHGVWDKATGLGCDMLLTADYGNRSISDHGRWAYAEYARRGRWGELARLLLARPDDPRSLPRKLVALALLPHLARPLRRLARGLVHPARRDMTALFTLLSQSERQKQSARAKARGSKPAWDDFTFPRSHAEAGHRYSLLANGPAADVNLAFEQIHGIRRRDVTAYRPLIEFCLGLPTEQFAAQGVERRLARRMAQGRMPQEQQLETRQGQHNVDWHARMTPRREELVAYARAMQSHPRLNQIADCERIVALLENWPERPDFSWEGDFPRMLGLPRIILAAQFIGFAEGRNDL